MGTVRLNLFAIGVLALAAPMVGAEPPTSFRLFGAGWNDTEKGRFLFDDEAARAVMAAYEAHGVDRMIDLEHLSLDPEARHYDPDARGWCRLQLRNGELWAVDVRWTDDGRERLSGKRQRYISPAFKYDPDTRRVLELWNVALVAQPATREAEALVAASLAAPGAVDAQSTPTPEPTPQVTPEQWGQLLTALRLGPNNNMADVVARVVELAKKVEPAPAALSRAGGSMGLDKQIVSRAMDVLAKADQKGALELVKEILVYELAEPGGDAEPDAGDPNEPAEQADGEPAEMAADPKDPNAAPADGEDPEKKKAAMAAASKLLRLTGKRSLVEALSAAEAWRASHLEREAELAKLAAERAALEAGERRKLVAELVKLGAETPHTSGLANNTIVKRLADEPLDELRARVGALSKRPAGPAPRTPSEAPSPQVAPAALNLTREQLALCESTGCDPATFAANRTALAARFFGSKA